MISSVFQFVICALNTARCTPWYTGSAKPGGARPIPSSVPPLLLCFALCTFYLALSTRFAFSAEILDVTSPDPILDPILDPTRWTAFNSGNGLDAPVRAMYEDRDGNIWFGTDSGAERYDGYNLESYPIDDGLTDQRVRAIVQTDNEEM